jgi:diketogulonate reductase-like aldo/keto reductase
MAIPTVTLSNGVEMPVLSVGLAFWNTKKGAIEHNPAFTGFVPEQCYRSVELALRAGLRSFDTALVYRTHAPTRSVLSKWFLEGKIERKDLWIASKVYHFPSDHFGQSNTVVDMARLSPEQVTRTVTKHVEQCLQELGMGYLDLLLLHWPAPPAPPDSIDPLHRRRRLAAWQVLEEYYDRGWLRAIGVSNFTEIHLQQLQEDGAKIVPMVNQIEASVFLQWNDIVKYCQTNNIHVQAFSPLGHGATNVVNDATVKELAVEHNKDAGQIAMRYLIQKGYSVVFSSSSAARLQSNQNLFDYALSEEDMKRLDALNGTSGSTGQPSPYNMS